jgi:hypothetical protein
VSIDWTKRQQRLTPYHSVPSSVPGTGTVFYAYIAQKDPKVSALTDSSIQSHLLTRLDYYFRASVKTARIKFVRREASEDNF